MLNNDMKSNPVPGRFRFALAIVAIAVFVSACGGSSGSGVRGENNLPTLQLQDGDVIAGGSNVVRIAASDDTGIASVTTQLLRQGNLQECSVELDSQLVANSLLEACLADQLSCAVDFIPSGTEIVVYPPPLYAPVGLEYELSLVDRDGSETDPIKAVFCFDVAANMSPQPAADTYQVIYSNAIQKRGVIYNNRCEKQAGSEGVLFNDDDDEHVTNSCLQAELLSSPRFAFNSASFAASFRPDGGFRYDGSGDIPPVDASGRSVDTFTYRVTDGVNPPSDPITVEIVFSGENVPPVAQNDNFTVVEDAVMQRLDVLANDTDPDALPLSIETITNGPINGIADIRNGVLVEYQPNENYHGTDQFTYTALDSGGWRVSASVVIEISAANDAPTAENDRIATNKNVAVDIAVLANDADLDGDTLTVSGVAAPVNGTAVINANGSITYTPDLNYFGDDPFEYTIADGNGGSDTATAIVEVLFINVPPIAVADQLTIAEDAIGTIDILANDSDGDSDALEILELGQPSSGVAEIVSATTIRYTPVVDFSGDDRFSYRISDGTVEAVSEVVVTVTAVNDNPVAEDDVGGTAKNTPLTIDVRSNDSDPDTGASTLVVSIVTAPTSGTATVVDNAIRYVPTTGFDGVDSLVYRITDAIGATADATVTITVSNFNLPPQAVNDEASTNEDEAITIDVLANDSDPDGDTLSITDVSAPANGTATLAGRSIVYQPSAGFSAQDSFSYQIEDGNGGSASATVTVGVSNVNRVPEAVADTNATSEDTPVIINVLGNDSDPDGAITSVSVSLVTQPGNGTATLVGNSVRYAPDVGFDGTDSLIYRITDADGATAEAVVTITVSNDNLPPLAVNDSASTNENDPVTVNVLVNDTDADGDAVSISAVSAASRGTVTLTGNAILYQPEAGFSGTDSFTYSIEDGKGGVATATVNVTVSNVNKAPLAVADSATTSESTAVTIDVLGNDSDPDSLNANLTVSIVTAPENGTVVLVGNSIRYTPNDDFDGDDTLIYQIADADGATANAVVTISVSNVNVPPQAVNDSASTNENDPVTVNVLANDTDADGDAVSISTVDAASSGTVTLVGNAILYQPEAGFSGTDSFAYSIEDGKGGVATATVTVTVSNVNEAPRAVADSASTSENTAVTIDVLGNDTDPDSPNANLTVSIVTAPANGTAALEGNSIRYTPSDGFDGEDTLIYRIEDADGASAEAVVTIVVSNVNLPPQATDDATSTDQEVVVVIGVLANDTDPDNDALTIAEVGVASNGAATLIGNSISYQPQAGFSGTDSFDYSIEDGNGGSATATVTVDVNSVNSAPVALPDAATTAEGSPVTIDVLANDTDADGDALSISIETDPQQGSAEIQGAVLVYTPVAEFTGEDQFIYRVSDGTENSPTAVVTIQVTPVNGVPIAAADAAATTNGASVQVDVLDNDTDPDGDVLTVSIVTPPSNGQASVGANGAISYTPSALFAGDDSLTYQVDDGSGGLATALVTITVEVQNTAPIALADAASTEAGDPVSINVLDNDTDGENDPLTVSIATPPGNGDAEVLASNQIVYTPAANFSGADRFSYSIDDGNGANATAAVSITVITLNTAPVAIADLAAGATATPIIIDATVNDTDADVHTLSVTEVGAPQNGVTELLADGTISYTSDAGFSGTDEFQYTISDGNDGTASATVTVEVGAPDSPPVTIVDAGETSTDV